MNRAVGFIVAAVIAGSGCGDNIGPPPMTGDELLVRLRALHGVTVELGDGSGDLSYYILHFTQPIDHSDASKGTFQQRVSLLHRNELAPVPMIIYTSGYADEDRNRPVELTKLLDANQVSIEHRFYGESQPSAIDWSKLTIDQAAADEHEIIIALRSIYEGAFLSAGESKGGMTAVIHRRFYPEDVDGTVAYVAPISFSAPDPRYPAQFDMIGSDDCRQAVRLAAGEMLARRDQMLDKVQQQPDHSYTRVKIGPAVEAAIAGLEWGFWQNAGAEFCGTVPATTASDDDLFAFLEQSSPVSEYDDKRLGYYAPYYYQSYAQLGYPDDTVAYLTNQMWYGEADYLGELPTTEPPYDSDAMRDIVDWVQDPNTDLHRGKGWGKQLMFVYGGWDPWYAGRFPTGSAGDTKSFTKDQGNHETQIAMLDQLQRVQAFSMLKQWTGVEPVLSRLAHASDAAAREIGNQAPRTPPLLLRAARR